MRHYYRTVPYRTAAKIQISNATCNERQQESSEEELEEDETRGRMAYIADYLLHRVSMPDEHGNILQPDVTQPGVQVISSGAAALT